MALPQAPPRRNAWLALGLALLAGSAAATALEDGEWLEITGLVTDRSGTPLRDVRVVFEASRRYFSFRHLGKREKDLRRVEASPDERGEYRVRWLWDDYFNTFEIGVALPVPAPGGEELHVLERVELTSRRAHGSPWVVPLVVDDTTLIEELRRFEASLSSDDEHRVYREMGYPDEVKRMETARRVEVSWWYFDRGEAYHFSDGTLREVVPFEPVPMETDHGGPRP